MWLIVRTGPDVGTVAELPDDGTFVLGRQRGCDLIVRDVRASRRHLELSPGGDGTIRLRDLGSANGTYLDGVRVTKGLLKGGEELRIGDIVIDVAPTAPPSEVRAPRENARGSDDASGHARTVAEMPQVATHSMVQRMVEAGTRRAHRTAIAAGAVAVAAVLGVLLVTGTLGGGDDVPEVVEALAPSTVLVETLRDGDRTGTGSGWVLDAGEGLIVTNGHVVNQGTSFRVAADGRTQPATVVGVAPCEDLALLRVRETAGLKTAPLAPPGSVERGESVVALGLGADANAGDQVGSTTGVVSVVHAKFRDPAPDVPAYPDAIQTDTALNPGNSGGPLADLDARVVGVNSAARTTGSDGRPLQNVNYAIHIDRAREVLADLRADRAAGWTGLTFAYPTDEELSEAGLPPGLRVTGAIGGTPAADAEIAPGALLAGINGTRLGPTLRSYCDVVGTLRSGTEVVLSFAEPGKTTTRQVRLKLA